MPPALQPDASRYDIVRHSLTVIQPRAERIARTFHQLLLAKHPALGPLFARTDFRREGRLLMETLAWSVQHLHEPAVLGARLAELGRRHEGYGARPEHYDLVGECLLGALERELGPALFGDALRQAWAEVYLIVAAAMQDAGSIRPGA